MGVQLATFVLHECLEDGVVRHTARVHSDVNIVRDASAQLTIKLTPLVPLKHLDEVNMESV